MERVITLFHSPLFAHLQIRDSVYQEVSQSPWLIFGDVLCASEIQPLP